MPSLSFICLICSLVSGCAAYLRSEPAYYNQTQVYKIKVEQQQLKYFKQLVEEMQLQLLSSLDVDPNNTYDVVITPYQLKEFEERLGWHKYPFECVLNNLESVLEHRVAKIPKPVMEWTQYHPLEHIYKWLDYLYLRYPLVVKPYTIGFSYEGRPIKALKLSRKRGNKAIFIESSIHAIEWISSAASTCFLNKLLTSTERAVRQLSWNYDWIFVPVLNPDGLEYTRNVNPFWRKNRRPTGFANASGLCYGTDMNRNFDFQWKESGYNANVPCDDFYAGPAAASEPEVQALQRFVGSFPAGYIRMYLAMHSFGNILLLPYGTLNSELPSNYEQMLRISKGFADAARVKYGTDFLYGASPLILSPVSGSSKDWAYGRMHIPYTVTLELRDRGPFGFFLPPEQIIEVCEEITDGFVGLVNAAEQEHLFDGEL